MIPLIIPTSQLRIADCGLRILQNPFSSSQRQTILESRYFIHAGGGVYTRRGFENPQSATRNPQWC
jgi:hypothetical protein